MLLTGWNMDEALAVSKEEGYEDGFEAGIAQGISKGIEQGERRGIAKGIEQGEQRGMAQKQNELIRKFSKINTPEQIAEILQLSKEYVLSVLQDPDVCT